MNKKFGVKIAGTGSYFPERILTNADLEKMVDTSDEWITTRTGIKERRIAHKQQATSDLALEASREALKSAGMNAQDIDLIMVATVTPDMFFPSTGCYLQKKLGAGEIPSFDLAAACSGFIYGISIAKGFIESGIYRNILLVGAETLSKVTDWTDRNTCVLFGDGAGAMILSASQENDDVLSVFLGSNGAYSDLLYLPAGGSAHPATLETVNEKLHTMKMLGKEVFKAAVPKMALAAEKALEIADKKPKISVFLFPIRQI